MKDDALKTCPKEKCRKREWGKGKVKRLLGAGAGLIFKGSGFYITDYRSKGYTDAAKKDKPSEAKPAESTKSEPAKPAKAPAEKKAAKSKD
jgi:predicted nucleic acid-binding Zn ribbon protein